MQGINRLLVDDTDSVRYTAVLNGQSAVKNDGYRLTRKVTVAKHHYLVRYGTDQVALRVSISNEKHVPGT